MKVHILPIEPFEERYTEQWLRWWPSDLESLGLETDLILGTTVGDRERDGGEFLDPCKTWIWKGAQVSMMAERFRSGDIKDGDVVLSLDGWGPATTAAAYMRDALKRDVRLVAFLHAGSYDPWDFLARQGMGRWAANVERGWLQALDLILVGSEFHAKMLVETRQAAPERIFVCGVPVKACEFGVRPVPWSDRPPLVVFPHRLAPEKAPWEFEEVINILDGTYGDVDDVQWVATRDPRWQGTEWDGYTSKAHYYRLLSRARVVFSSARQETFGIAMQEGIALGAHPVAPHRLCYPEVIRGRMTYHTLEHAAELVYKGLKSKSAAEWDGYHEAAILRAGQEIRGRFA